MPFFSLRDRSGRELATVMAATAEDAAATSRARALPTFHEAVYAGSPGPGQGPSTEVVDALRDVAEARLDDALGRLGLSERARDLGSITREDWRPGPHAPESLLERSAADGLRAEQRLARPRRGALPGYMYGSPDETPQELEARQRARDEGRYRSVLLGGVDGPKRAEMFGALVRAGITPEDAARTAGLPAGMRSIGQTPVTLKDRAESTRAAPPAPIEPAAAAESRRGTTSDELVPLVEGAQQRLGVALGRAFNLTEAEARIAGEGRS